MKEHRRRRAGFFAAVGALVLVAAAFLVWGLVAKGGKNAVAPTTRPGHGEGSSGPAPDVPAPSGTPGIALGVYVKPQPGTEDQEAALGHFESSIDHRLSIVQTFTSWQTASGGSVPFPTQFVSYAETIGATPMITWQPEQAVDAGQSPGGLLSDQPNFSLAQLSSGRYDSYIRSWAEAAKAFGRVVYVRLMHEMNDSTYPWSVGVNGNTNAQEYVTAWRHIVGIFQAEGAANVQFVWCVGARPSSPNPVEYFPGDGYTSWISLDGYNRGKPWQSFTSIFSKAYAEITAVSSLPVMIAEMGSVEEPGNPAAKADWISSAFDQEIPQDFPRIRAVLYFDAPGRGFTYPLTSSAQALQAFTQVAGSALYQALPEG